MLAHKLTKNDDWFIKQNRIDSISRTHYAIGHEIVVCSNHHVMLADYYDGKCTASGCDSTRLIPFSEENVKPALKIKPTMTIKIRRQVPPTTRVLSKRNIINRLSDFLYTWLIPITIGGVIGLVLFVLLPMPENIKRIILLLLYAVFFIWESISLLAERVDRSLGASIRQTANHQCCP